jgi:hypothetical protein
VKAGYFELIEPEPMVAGQRHYKIEYDLVIRVRGRNLTYEALVANKKYGGERISIAAAFIPGTS